MKKFILFSVVTALLIIITVSSGSASQTLEQEESLIPSPTPWPGVPGWTYPFPPPEEELAPKGAVYKKWFGSIHCPGVSEDNLSDYLKLLQQEGFELFEYDSKQDIYITLTRENESIIIVNQSFLDQSCIDEIGDSLMYSYGDALPYIDVSYSRGYEGSGRGRITKEEAIKLIQDYIDNSQDYVDNSGMDKFTVYKLIERDTGEAFDKIGIQEFAAYSTEGYQGTFYVCNGSVTANLFGGETVTADIDKDGEFEFLLLFGLDYGGSYVTYVTAFKYGALPGEQAAKLYEAYRVTYNSDAYEKLTLVKASDTEVHLYSADFTNDGVNLIKDYGPLLIRGNELYIDAKYFPFETWD